MTFSSPSVLAFLSMPGGWEWLIIAGIGLLLFGKRLPEVGRAVGRSIVEFKKGIRGVEDEINSASTAPATPASLDSGRTVSRVATGTPESSPVERGA